MQIGNMYSKCYLNIYYLSGLASSDNNTKENYYLLLGNANKVYKIVHKIIKRKEKKIIRGKVKGELLKIKHQLHQLP